MAGKRTTLKYPREYYYVEAYESGILTPKEARQEYNRLRKVAQQRLKALGESRFSEWNIYQRNKEAFRLSGGKITDAQIGRALYDVMKFVTAKTSTITGAAAVEKKSLESLRKAGADFITKSNIASFGEYMKRARALMQSKIFDSERALELFQAASDKDISPEALTRSRRGFLGWLDDVEALADMPEYKSTAKGGNAEYYRNSINRKKRRGEL